MEMIWFGLGNKQLCLKICGKANVTFIEYPTFQRQISKVCHIKDKLYVRQYFQ